jgi:hypothetical protein
MMKVESYISIWYMVPYEMFIIVAIISSNMPNDALSLCYDYDLHRATQRAR